MATPSRSIQLPKKIIALSHLLQRSLVELVALSLYGDTCLHSTISDLANKHGLTFKREREKHQHQGGLITDSKEALMPNKQSLLCLSNNDTLLIGLGEALEALNQDEQQLDRRAIQEPGNAHVIERLTTDLNIRREAIFSAISAVPASSIKGAAIQMRALAWLNSLDTPAAEDERSRLLYSILTVLEKNGGGSRNQWGGNFGLPECCNPFSLSNTDLNSNVALTQRRDADADIVAVGAGKDGDV